MIPDRLKSGIIARRRWLANEAKWDRRFIDMAKHVAEWSKDPSTKIGAVIVDDLRRIVSLGYNGFPRGLDDSPEIYADREKKYSRVVHAEMNAILNARSQTEGTTLYLSGLPPCDRCAVHVIQAGITRVVYEDKGEPIPDRWKDAMGGAAALFREANVELVGVTL